MPGSRGIALASLAIVTKNARVVFAVALLLAGCSKSVESLIFGNRPKVCTLLGCHSGLAIEVRGDMQRALYEVRSSTDGGPLRHCSVDTRSAPPGFSGDCEGIRVTNIGIELKVPLPEVRELEFELTRDGVPLVERTLRPAYQNVYLNGAHCGVTCRSGGFELIELD